VTAPALESAAWRALSTVLDPELDQPITDLGFVAALEVIGHDVHVDLRLPTYFCAPNFAYLMVADAHDALTDLPQVGEVRVRLLDHFAAAEVTAGVAAGAGFGSAFSSAGSGELEGLRRTFLRKAHAAYQEVLAGRLLRDGLTHEDLVGTRLDALPDSPELTTLRRRREQLGLPSDGESMLLIDDEGAPLTVEELPVRLRFARTTRISIEGNAGWCRGLLGTRYGGHVDQRAV
jgi:metal-sulfur cluster biosynthetic enzyme